ncbi:phage repressor protein [Salinicoccus carnicancri]|uniref:phage repressor protein n=1 Tax=Salinicoccus carnicancri TaxID=558170 RepID=UPI0002E27CC3|nr:phage repressor protein [Salinicoccus carnicancri]
MNPLQVFDFENQNVRTVVIKDEPHFIGRDVASILGYANSRDALTRHVDEEDRGVAKLDTPGGKQNQTIINESGLYSLIFASRLDSAKRFKRWVTSEVLPAIRKTGSYEVTKDPLEIMKLSMKALEQTNEDVKSLKSDVTYLKDEVKLEVGEYNFLSKHINRVVRETISTFAYANNNEVRSELYKDINSGVNQVTGVKTRSQLKQKHFDTAFDFINQWTPSTATRMKVKQLTMNLNEEAVND